MSDKKQESNTKEQISLKISSKVLENWRLEVQKKFGRTHTHLGETLEEALTEWSDKQRLIRKQKKEMEKKNDT